MLLKFRFKFKCVGTGLKVSGNGTVKAETLDLAMGKAAESVAETFSRDAKDVVITSISRVHERKKKAKPGAFPAATQQSDIDYPSGA